MKLYIIGIILSVALFAAFLVFFNKAEIARYSHIISFASSMPFMICVVIEGERKDEKK
jgi:hypothetical protein